MRQRIPVIPPLAGVLAAFLCQPPCARVQYHGSAMNSPFPLHERPLLSRLQDEVHIWLLQPEAVTEPALLSAFLASLSDDERSRQQRFRFDADRKLYLVAHGMLRRVLSRYVEVAPSSWQFTTGSHGKPAIAGPRGLPALRFNLSHTQGLAACVICLHSECGIDVERVRAVRSLQGIAKRMFAGPEQADIEACSDPERLDRFFRYWTLHEAYCKATGTGIARAASDFSFELDATGAARIRFKGLAGDEADDWQFGCLQPLTGYVLSLALRIGASAEKRIIHGFLID